MGRKSGLIMFGFTNKIWGSTNSTTPSQESDHRKFPEIEPLFEISSVAESTRLGPRDSQSYLPSPELVWEVSYGDRSQLILKEPHHGP